MTHTTTDAAEARATALAECAAIAERWRDENKASAAKARKSARVRGDNGMADQLEGAAIECNAIAQEIRRLATAEAASGAGEREAFVRLCEALGIPATAGAYLEVPRILASLPPATDPAMVTGETVIGWLQAEQDRLDKESSDYLMDTKDCINVIRERSAALAAAPTIPATGEADDDCPCGIGDQSDIGHFHESWCPATGHAATEGEGA